MDVALVLAALLMGLAGVPHCTTMCAAACSGVVRGCGARSPRSASFALHAGRVASYAAAGALVAAGLGSVGRLAEFTPVLRPVWSLFHAAALGFGIWLVWHGEPPAWLGRARQPNWIAPPRSGRPWLAGVAGAGWALLPCGLLQSALVVASMARSAGDGAVVMAAFAVATTVGLETAPWLWRRVQQQRWPRRGAVRLAGLMLCASSLYALLSGLGRAIDGLCLSLV